MMSTRICLENGDWMQRKIYVAGVNGRKLAEAANHIPYWLMSVTLIRSKRTGIPHEWLIPYLEDRVLLYDPGTFSDNPVTYEEYLRFIQEFVRPQDEYLQYDIIGDAEQTTWYLDDMRDKGFDPIPVFQRGCDPKLLQEPRVAIGGLVRMSEPERFAYLDSIFYGDNQPTGNVHLLGMRHPKWFRRYPALRGDSTTWIQMTFCGTGTYAEWLEQYGEQEIPFDGPDSVQMRLEV